MARNPIKHGFFARQDNWTAAQHRDFEELLDGLREDLKPQDSLQEGCVLTIAQSYVRMASVLRYENLAAHRYHQEQDRELNQHIAAAEAKEAARLRANRDKLRRAGLWRPTIPGPREARAISRCMGRLDLTIGRAIIHLESLKNTRIGGPSDKLKVQKQTHFEASPSRAPRLGESPRMPLPADTKAQKQTHYPASPNDGSESGEGPREVATTAAENPKANPLSSMFMGNRHARRRAKALAARQRLPRM